jgi:hypothetical protein
MKKLLQCNYPLYIVLKNDAQTCAIDKKTMRDIFLKSLAAMNQDEYDSIFIIIKLHSNISGKINIIPYDGVRKDNGDVIFNFNKFPQLLQKMLYSFAMRFNDNQCETN